jgi:uncharacterized repeat protein (TIGR03943 family)
MRGVALALWALVLLQSGTDGRLDLLLRATFHPLVSAAGGALLILALLQLVAGLAPGGSPGSGDTRGDTSSERRRDSRIGLATAAIAVLIIALPPNPSFADLASQRPADNTSHDTLSFVVPPAQRSLTDWVRLLRSQPDPRLYTGDPVRISGFVLPMPDGPPQIARLLVRCCLADATPVGLPVRWPDDRPAPATDQWLAIEGRMAVEPHAGGERVVVVPQRIEPIPRPRRPLEP